VSKGFQYRVLIVFIFVLIGRTDSEFRYSAVNPLALNEVAVVVRTYNTPRIGVTASLRREHL
jgi:hypothetical protein